MAAKFSIVVKYILTCPPNQLVSLIHTLKITSAYFDQVIETTPSLLQHKLHVLNRLAGLLQDATVSESHTRIIHADVAGDIDHAAVLDGLAEDREVDAFLGFDWDALGRHCCCYLRYCDLPAW